MLIKIRTFNFFFFLLKFYWSIVDLQSCASFCYTADESVIYIYNNWLSGGKKKTTLCFVMQQNSGGNTSTAVSFQVTNGLLAY